MSAAARSLLVFGIYVLVLGVVFVAFPQAVIELLRLPAISDGWFRIIGILSLVIGAYDVTGARHDLTAYIRASVPVRVGFAAGCALLVVFRQMPPVLLLFGATDLAGALWTATALRRGRAAA